MRNQTIPNILITESGTGVEKTQAHTPSDYISSVEYAEPILYNEGNHPNQTIWYKDLPPHIKKVIDKFKNYTPAWSQKRVPWYVGDFVIKQEQQQKQAARADA